jgi:hypothetical protein
VCVVVGTWRGWASQEEDCHQTMSFFFHFILKIKREIRGGKFFDFFFCWANDLLREKTIENAPSVFSLFSFYFPSQTNLGLSFSSKSSNSPPFYFIPARNFASRVDLLHAGHNNGIFSFPKLIIT